MNRNRQISERFSCGVVTLQDNSTYEWEDLLDMELPVKRDGGVTGYDIPDILSQQVVHFSKGDYFQISEFVTVDGQLWIGTYLSLNDYNNFNPTWIPLIGQPGTSLEVPVETIRSVFGTMGILTKQEEDAITNEENKSIIDKIGDMLRSGVGIIAGAVIIGSIIKGSKDA